MRQARKVIAPAAGRRAAALCAAILLAAASSSFAASILRGPYVENVGGDTATLRFRADASAPAWLSYGAYPDCERFMTLSPEGTEHKVALFGLLSDTTHCYRIHLPDTESTGVYKAAESVFRTFRAGDKPYLEFLAFGDSASASEEQLEIAARMEAFDPDFVIHTGDLVESGLDSDADREYYVPYRNLISKYPFYIALGNHDYGKRYMKAYEKKFLRENYIPFHSMPYTGIPPYFYFFENGNARFFVLDTNYFYGIKWAQPLDPASKQYKWLEHFLARNDKTWKFVVVHEPLYSTGAHGELPEIRRVLGPLLEKYDVDLVFQGHDHNYERTYPVRDGVVDEAGGIVYVTLGGGGSPLYFQRSPADWSAKFLPVYHFAHVAIKDRHFLMTVYDREGKVIDTLELRK